MFGLTHKEKIKKLMEAITPIADTVKLCTSKKNVARSQGQCKKWFKNGNRWSY